MSELSSPTRPIVILGAGGHGRTVAATLLQAQRPVMGFLDANPDQWGQQFFGVAVLGGDGQLETLAAHEVRLANGVGSTDVPQRRRQIFLEQQARGYTFETVVHPAACVSPYAQLGPGTQVMAGAIVQAGARIGANVIVNTGAIIEHDCAIGAHSHIAPGAVLSGTVCVGEACHIGAGAVVLQGIELGAHSLVAAGAVVTRSHGPQSRLVGVPAKAME